MRFDLQETPEQAATAADWQRVERFLQLSKAQNTLKAYRSDWKHFVAWCRNADRAPLPATPQTVASYIAEMAEDYKFSTIRRRLTSINKAHDLEGLASPGRSPLVREVKDGIKREIGAKETGKDPLLTDDIVRMVEALGDDLAGARDRCLLLVGFAGCFRRSELVSLDVDDLRFRPEGVVVSVEKSKTDQYGEGTQTAIPYGRREATCPVSALRHWLDVSAITEGAVFRPINKHGHIRPRRLTAGSVALIVKRTAIAAGLDPEKYAGHSLRSGFATQAARSGAKERLIMKQGAWSTDKMVRRYIRDASMFDENAADDIGL